ncbi:MAG TPA: PAS domain-containing sensor histidine kinase [Elusimicrobiota bacterium]|nr:PAS domain-containing sensor histidine kinase [Elusimicrobiota bacterium]
MNANSLDFLDSVVENIPDMVFVKGAKDLRFVLLNRAGEELLGRPRAELIGKTDYDLFPKDEADFFTAKDRETLASGRALDIPEETIQTARKGRRVLHTKKIAIPGPDGKPAYLLGISEDVTERKRADRLTSEIVSMTTHELRTPLTSVLWGLDLLVHGEEGRLGGRAAEIAELSYRSAQLMARLIDDYVDVVKLESGRTEFHLRPQDLAELVEKAVRDARPFASSFGVALELTLEAPGALVEADPVRLTQALANLLSNAAKFSPEKGTVSVAVGRRPGGVLRVAVVDRGPGVPEDFSGKIFQKFARARAQDARRRGTGLGLSIAKAIVERLNGRIGFENGPGAGATFYVELPELPPR